MSRNEKLLNRLRSVPTDFTWDELVSVLAYYGYKELKSGKTGGSRRKFSNDQKRIIALHKPHPSNLVKGYAIRQVIEYLKTNEHMKHE